MSNPQPAIFVEDTPHHHYLEYAVDPAADLDVVRAAVAEAAAAIKSGGPVNTVVAFGPDLWARLGGVAVDVTGFETISGVDGYTAPATQRDLFFWIHGAAVDDNLDRAFAVQAALGKIADLQLDERGFVYHDSRDLIGFVDGSANPEDAAAREAALIPDGQPGAGGSIVLSQRWNHDLEKFATLPVKEQERVIGRTKAESIELEGDAMPDDSHVSRTDVSEDGVALKIYRRSAPFGKVGVHGLYFLAFACAQHRIDIQLQRMFGLAGDGLHDRIIEFSTADTGSYWFAPSEDDLAAVLAMRG